MIKVKENLFYLQGKGFSYVLGVDPAKRLLHLYFGKQIAWREETANELDTWTNHYPADWPIDDLRLEFPTYGLGEFRSPVCEVENEAKNRLSDFKYESYEILKGKPTLEGLPAVYAKDSEAETLEITLKDPVLGLKAILSYTIMSDYEVLCRNTRFVNEGGETLTLRRAFSMSIDLPDSNYDLLSFPGAWTRERRIQRTPLLRGTIDLFSRQGSSSHQMNPFQILCTKDTTETNGMAYGFSLVYSGNHKSIFETDHNGHTRVQMGINPDTFEWVLAPSDSFQTPEVVMAFSDKGLGKLSRTYHHLYRNNLCRGEWQYKERPVLINNWEATYFDFNEEKLLAIAENAKKIGIELFVLDDGWFGKRDDDTTSLGDWFPDPKKLPNGITGLAEKITEKGLAFGLWFEPEMISPDSELYRNHPDWAIHVDGRPNIPGRNQYVLDLSRKEVREYVIEAVSNVLGTAKISYVKWDMNRGMTNMPNGAFAHAFILGLYEVMDAITSRFPHVLFEGCAGGGGRFDPGILYYMPQIWTSDDSNAKERLKIQYGTSMCYPVSTMGAHVTAIPNHQTGRSESLKARGDVAFFGNFGYELDISKCTPEELDEMKEQIVRTKKYRKFIHEGDFYRLLNPMSSDDCAWQVVSPDKKETLVLYAKMDFTPNTTDAPLKLEGLCPEKLYVDEEGRTYGGDELMYRGLTLPRAKGDMDTYVFHLTEK